MAVFLTQLRHRGNAVKGHIFHPLGHLLHRTASHVSVDVGFAAKLPAQLKKLMCPEAVVLHYAAPVGIYHAFSRLFRADAVLPVILVRKAAARPAQHRDLYLLKRLHHVRAHTVLIRDPGILPDIKPFVNTSAQMLGKMPVDLRIDPAFFALFIDIKRCHFV